MNTSFTRIDLEPPAGYQEGYILRYPVLALNIAAIALFGAMAPLLGMIIWRTQGIPVQAFDLLLTPLGSVVLLAITIVTVATHELIHGGVLHYYGYRVAYGVSWRLLVAYAAAFGQFQQRRHALLNALAPLVVITAAVVPLLLVPNRTVAIGACIALLTNTTGAVGDLYITWRLLRLPRRTLLYDVDPAQVLIYIPSSALNREG